jgi:predicted site-specific integrase-resolvase
MKTNSTTVKNTQPTNLLTRKRAALRLAVCTETIKRLEKRGRLPAVRINSRTVRYRTEDIEKLIRESLVTKHASPAN